MSTHVVLDQTEEAFVEGLVASGRFATAAGVVQAALHLLQDRETRLSDLRGAWTEGCESGDWQSADTVFGDLDRRYASATSAVG